MSDKEQCEIAGLIMLSGGSDSKIGKKPDTITANGSYFAVNDELDGYSSVEVKLNILPKPDVITANGIYYASADSLDGYSRVTVNVNTKKVYTSAEEAQSDLDNTSVTPQATTTKNIPVTFHASATTTTTSTQTSTKVWCGYVNSETGEWVAHWGTDYGSGGITEFRVMSWHLESTGWYCLYSYKNYKGEYKEKDQWFASENTFTGEYTYILDEAEVN